MNTIYARPVRDLRNNYAELEKIIENHNRIMITKNGKSVAVLLNIEDYYDIDDFLNAKYVAQKLGEAEKEEVQKPNDSLMDYKDFFKNMKEKYRGL